MYQYKNHIEPSSLLMSTIYKDQTSGLLSKSFCGSLSLLRHAHRVLILHLKRYSFNAQLSMNSKLGQQVMIPRHLTLSSHCTEATRPPLSLCWSAQATL